ncbi:hypothetical protein PV325_012594 [Microctonus aethiopoides]|nr:hypothetical protein PV325_012594 [Microctonus aethiopoides]
MHVNITRGKESEVACVKGNEIADINLEHEANVERFTSPAYHETASFKVVLVRWEINNKNKLKNRQQTWRRDEGIHRYGLHLLRKFEKEKCTRGILEIPIVNDKDSSCSMNKEWTNRNILEASYEI